MNAKIFEEAEKYSSTHPENTVLRSQLDWLSTWKNALSTKDGSSLVAKDRTSLSDILKFCIIRVKCGDSIAIVTSNKYFLDVIQLPSERFEEYKKSRQSRDFTKYINPGKSDKWLETKNVITNEKYFINLRNYDILNGITLPCKLIGSTNIDGFIEVIHNIYNKKKSV